MKSMNCNQLGGACEKIFTGNSFEELAQQSQMHAHEMMGSNDPAHMQAMGRMMDMMKTDGAVEDWMSERRKEFEALPAD